MNIGIFLPNLFEQSFVPQVPQVQLYVDQNKVKDFSTMSNGPHPTFCIFAIGFPLSCSFFFKPRCRFLSLWVIWHVASHKHLLCDRLT